mmetsp:Transcript_35162/g.56494  ORF Transcript_35162/g.56494 Transcript_35162/m.56494 type:complete len:85 (+) Transcript_35162:3925-4179(+)
MFGSHRGAERPLAKQRLLTAVIEAPEHFVRCFDAEAVRCQFASSVAKMVSGKCCVENGAVCIASRMSHQGSLVHRHRAALGSHP